MIVFSDKTQVKKLRVLAFLQIKSLFLGNVIVKSLLQVTINFYINLSDFPVYVILSHL